MPSASRDPHGIDEEEEEEYTPLKSSKEIGDEVGVSASTVDRVKTIMEQGSPEQIEALKQKSETGEGPGVRTTYEQIQQEKLKKKLHEEQGPQKIEAALVLAQPRCHKVGLSLTEAMFDTLEEERARRQLGGKKKNRPANRRNCSNTSCAERELKFCSNNMNHTCYCCGSSKTSLNHGEPMWYANRGTQHFLCPGNGNTGATKTPEVLWCRLMRDRHSYIM
jgi:hypothetical protein